MMKRILFLTISILFSVVLTAQEVSNVWFEQVGKEIHIYYDLNSNENCHVGVFCNNDDAKIWDSHLEYVSGDVGYDIAPGKGKLIVWNVLKEKDKLIGNVKFKIEILASNHGFFTDERDGHTYRWVRIGDQIWMAENLNYIEKDNSWCYKNNKYKCATYGRLYTWNAARLVCPSGWHLPSFYEWNELIQYFTKPNKTSTKTQNHDGTTNLHIKSYEEFSIKYGGMRNSDGNYVLLLTTGLYWTSTEIVGNFPKSVLQMKNANYLQGDVNYYLSGLSVRCIKD